VKIKVILAILFTIYLLNTQGQDTTYLRLKAVKIENQDSLGDDIYESISGYQLFMLGEAHGTKESARFIQSLAELLTRKGNHVQMGLEIPSEQMKKYLLAPSDSNIYYSDFFAGRPYDSRSCFAWVNLIAKLNDNPFVEIFFYDINVEDFKKLNERDSLMYLKIKRRMQLHPEWKMITLSGNIHNMLVPFDGQPKMGLFLCNDQELKIADKILSLNHCYGKGEVWDNWGNSLKLFQVDNTSSIFTKTVDYENYLFLYPHNAQMKYSGIYYTRKVTPSNLTSKRE